MKKLKEIYAILKQTIVEFGEDRVMKKSASLTYYALFSLSPLVLIIISLAGFFYEQDTIEERFFLEMEEYVGTEMALQIQTFADNSLVSGDNTLMLIIGVGVLAFGATKMFADLQDSLNLIWRIEAVREKAWLSFLLTRGLSFLVIGGIGILLFSTVLLSSILSNFGSEIFDYIGLDESISSGTVLILNNILSFLLSVFAFYLIFRILPEAKMPNKPLIVGATLTAALFFVARYFIIYYLSLSKYNAVFGSAGSIVVLLLFIYYNATILYFGAKFTKVYANMNGFSLKRSKSVKERVITFE